MNFDKKTVKDVPLAGKTVLVRTGFDVPLEELGNKVVVANNYRIIRGLPTIKYLVEQGCKVVLTSKLGRPKSKEPSLSTAVVAAELQKLINMPVKFCSETVGHTADNMKKGLRPGEILFLENTRFNDGEKSNDSDFARSVAKHCDYFVQDGFSIAHRKEALVDAITHFLPSVSGLLLADEVESINHAMNDSENPRCAIVGGAKVATKITLLNKLIDSMDMIVIGGAMANTFYAAEGFDVGASVYDKDEVDLAKGISKELSNKEGLKFFIGKNDVAVATSVDEKQPRKEVSLSGVASDEMILDLGSDSTKELLAFIKPAKTVIWNGPLGLVEQHNFAHSSAAVAHYLADNKEVYSLIGGGDTASFIDKLGLTDKIDFVSTGGGASLQLISGEPLPGLEALM